jgi:hypothetical protein
LPAVSYCSALLCSAERERESEREKPDYTEVRRNQQSLKVRTVPETAAKESE